VAGLVAITPACAYITPWASVLLGLAAGVLCGMATGLKYLFKVDDSLDVFGVHFVGGWIGCLWIGLFSIKDGSLGLFNGGGLTQFGKQAFGAGVVSVWSFGVALAVGVIVKYTVGLRVKSEDEVDGIDIAEHKETAYDFSTGTGGGGAFAAAGIGTSKPAGASPEAQPAQPANV
jgi:ammonium transporter, Amt family